jgi:hypothetical protein
LWIWKEPEIGHKYVMGVDVSRGDSEERQKRLECRRDERQREERSGMYE